MKDEYGNECDYDFKNIMFKRYLLDTFGTDHQETNEAIKEDIYMNDLITNKPLLSSSRLSVQLPIKISSNSVYNHNITASSSSEAYR
jgi:hypothetical protein